MGQSRAIVRWSVLRDEWHILYGDHPVGESHTRGPRTLDRVHLIPMRRSNANAVTNRRMICRKSSPWSNQEEGFCEKCYHMKLHRISLTLYPDAAKGSLEIGHQHWRSTIQSAATCNNVSLKVSGDFNQYSQRFPGRSILPTMQYRVIFNCNT